MAKINSGADLTDQLDKEIKEARNGKKPEKKVLLSKNKQAALATSAVLLGGSALAFTALNKGAQQAITTPEKPAAGTVDPSEEIDVAHNINDDMSFDDAFIAARTEVGAGGVFTWHGNVYNTYTKDEWGSMSLEQRQEFLKDVGFKPRSDDSSPIPDNTKPINPEPIFMETVIDGERVIVVDIDGDGIVDGIARYGEDGLLYVMTNEDSHPDLDTLTIIDPETGLIVDTVSLNEPIEGLTLEEMEGWDEAVIRTSDEDDEDEDDEDEDDEDEDDDGDEDDYDNDSDISDIS